MRYGGLQAGEREKGGTREGEGHGVFFAFTACEVQGASGGGGARGGARGKTKEVQACQSLFVPRLLFIPAACDGRS